VLKRFTPRDQADGNEAHDGRDGDHSGEGIGLDRSRFAQEGRG